MDNRSNDYTDLMDYEDIKAPKKSIKAATALPTIFAEAKNASHQDVFDKLYNGAPCSKKYGKINKLRGFSNDKLKRTSFLESAGNSTE